MCMAHPTCGPESYSDFQELLLTLSPETVTTLVRGYGSHHEWALKEPLPTVCSQFLWI